MTTKWSQNQPNVVILAWHFREIGDLLADPVPDGLWIHFGAQKVSSLGSKSEPLPPKSDPLASKSDPLGSKNDPQTKKNYPLESRRYPQTPNDHFEL